LLRFIKTVDFINKQNSCNIIASITLGPRHYFGDVSLFGAHGT
jgi:hypothetical protein